MTQASNTSHDEQRPTEPGSKREYLKPAFRHETVFETMALACGKLNMTQNACRGHRNAS